MRGSSGTVERCLSSACLKVSTEQPVRFLTSGGSVLNSRGPRIANEFSRAFLITAGGAFETVGTMHERPLRGWNLATIGEAVKLGASPSSIRHVYIAE